MAQQGNGDLLQFIAATVESLRDRMATKDDLAELRQETKAGFARLEARMDASFTAVRGDLERVNLRLDSIAGALSTRLSQLETEVSRLRSVVYLLVRDRPELLRLLGSDPPVV